MNDKEKAEIERQRIEARKKEIYKSLRSKHKDKHREKNIRRAMDVKFFEVFEDKYCKWAYKDIGENMNFSRDLITACQNDEIPLSVIRGMEDLTRKRISKLVPLRVIGGVVEARLATDTELALKMLPKVYMYFYLPRMIGYFDQ